MYFYPYILISFKHVIAEKKINWYNSDINLVHCQHI
jgi:hypothetical protein